MRLSEAAEGSRPRIVFFGLDGPYSAILLRALAATELAPVLVVLGVPGVSPVRHAIVELSSSRPPFWRTALERLWFKAPRSEPPPDPPAGAPTSLFSGSTRLLDVARSARIDVLRTSDPGALRARAEIRAVRPDALVVGGFHRLLQREVLDLFPRGGLNVHPGRLPAERGPSPLFWALKEGRTAIGWSIHLLEVGEDSGDLVATGEVSFEPGLDSDRILALVAGSAAPHLVKSLRNLLGGVIVRTPQPKEGRGRCPRPTHRDFRIDPNKPARAVFTFVAGCASSCSLFVEVAGDRFFIARALSYDEDKTLGFEYALTGDRLLLRTSPGVVELELEPEGALFVSEYGTEYAADSTDRGSRP